MLAVAQDTPAVEASERTTITTTLFDLIAALNDQVKPGEEDVVTAAVVYLRNTGRLRFLRVPRTAPGHMKVVTFGKPYLLTLLAMK